MRRIAAAIISFLLAAGCVSPYTSAYILLPDDKPEEGLVGIDYLKSLSTGRSTIIDKDVIIEGFVVANDFRGEFYKKAVIDDGRSGIEIDIDRQRLYQLIPLHAYIYISCNGLALGRSGGKFTLGAPPTGEYATDRISASDITRYIKVSDDFLLPEPVEIKVDQLAVQYISRYVCIRNLKIVEAEADLTWCDQQQYGDYDEDEEDYRNSGSNLSYEEWCLEHDSDRDFYDDYDTPMVRGIRVIAKNPEDEKKAKGLNRIYNLFENIEIFC